MKLGPVCITVFVAAYALLIPGLFATLFSAKATVFGLVLVDIEKSTIGAVQLLLKEHKWVPAGIILFFSILAPFVKLLVVLACWNHAKRKQSSDGVLKPRVCEGCRDQMQSPTCPRIAPYITAVQRISKWATVDALAATTIVAFFCGKPLVDVELHVGFYCFLGYCVLSVAAALMIEVEVSQEAVESYSGPLRPLRQRPLVALAGCLVVLLCSAIVTEIPILRLDSQSFSIHSEMSIKEMITQLRAHISKTAAASMAFFVVVFPVLEGFVYACKMAGFRINSTLTTWLHDFSMLDVFVLAMVVVALATSGLNKNLEMTILPKGWALCGLVVFGSVLPVIDGLVRPKKILTNKGGRKAEV